jgi:hypothetical protein
MRLEVFGAGPRRTGTSWLYTCLQQHDQLCFPKGVKEIAFLNARFDKGWAWYWSHFQHWHEGQMCAEMGPGAFAVPQAVSRLWEHNSRCRIIVNLRDPAARSFSLWALFKNRGVVNGGFLEATRTEPRILESSRYRKYLKKWIQTFGRAQVHVILLEDIVSSPDTVLDGVYHFLGIRAVPPPPGARERVGARRMDAVPALARVAERGGSWLRERRLYGPIELAKRLGLKRFVFGVSRQASPDLDPDVRQALNREFEPDIAYVEDLLDRPLDNWRQ